MTRALARRLTRLEQHVQARNAPTWPEVHAAEERLRTQARAHIDALLSGGDPPACDEPQARADAVLITRWCVAQRVPMDGAGARGRVYAKLAAIAARYAADPPVPKPSPHL